MFRDRAHAGLALAQEFHHYCRPDPLVLALPRGGLPVAEPVAEALHAELDILAVRKLGVPGQPEFAMGAVGEDGVVILDSSVVNALGISRERILEAREREGRELERRLSLYRQGRRAIDLANRNIIIIDDGLATGATARAAVSVARRRGAAHVTVAVPVGSVSAVTRLRAEADDVVCIDIPRDFYAVGQFFQDFPAVSDDEVTAVLTRHPLRPAGDRRATCDAEVQIPLPGMELPGHLCIPSRARGVVLFAHGSGSSRMSPRNQSVARALNSAGIGTLLFDLLSEDESRTRATVFDIDLLTRRLVAATDWVAAQGLAQDRPLGYFGASTGAAAALAAAAEQPSGIVAVVSRGGRPDLANGWLGHVVAPTLLIVGGNDPEVLSLNRKAQMAMRCPTLLEVVPGAGHLFEEPGALAQVARLAQSWFAQHMIGQLQVPRLPQDYVGPLSVAS